MGVLIQHIKMILKQFENPRQSFWLLTNYPWTAIKCHVHAWKTTNLGQLYKLVHEKVQLSRQHYARRLQKVWIF